MGIKINFNDEKLRKKTDINNLKLAQFALMNQVYADMNLYAPRKEGKLRDDSYVNGTTVFYPLPYAKAQFHGGFITKNGRKIKFSHYTTPGTGPRWDLKAKGMHMQSWQRAFVKGGNY
ncbi:minor capsid protein [Melissococcus plutonius]|uniref:minor capsid protein n=1 Tax=Melissococcus plutonius TaxID=33970 RepID=UPI0021E54470|nr:minor capsid protein [Melissococcus plutonius]MCV2505654.1 minor capsid protein [Melissococcus plutonius]